MKDTKENKPEESQNNENESGDPFDLSSSATRKLLIEKAGIDFEKSHRTLELHIYTPL